MGRTELLRRATWGAANTPFTTLAYCSRSDDSVALQIGVDANGTIFTLLVGVVTGLSPGPVRLPHVEAVDTLLLRYPHRGMV